MWFILLFYKSTLDVSFPFTFLTGLGTKVLCQHMIAFHLACKHTIPTRKFSLKSLSSTFDGNAKHQDQILFAEFPFFASVIFCFISIFNNYSILNSDSSVFPVHYFPITYGTHLHSNITNLFHRT
jgi:hypothetical protein